MHYTYHQTLKLLWNKGLSDYNAGGRDPGIYLSDVDQAFLKSIGANQQDLYDFVDDSIRYGEPDFETFLMVQSMRFNYFMTVMKEHPSDTVREPSTYTPKTAELEDIVWLPRIIEKAKDKLRGELDPDVMYGCGGDREFFKKYKLHPAEFLQLVWNHWEDNQSIVAYLKNN